MSDFKFERILLIDDNEIDNFINRKLIEKTSFAKNIIEKQSAKTAIEYLTDVKEDDIPDIIFLDIMMPIMDGFGFLEEFEKLNEKVRKKSKIVMLSSSESFKDLNRANANKYVARFINKPLNEKVLEVIH